MEDKVIVIQLDCLMAKDRLAAFRKTLLKQMEEGLVVVPPWAHVAYIGDECTVEIKVLSEDWIPVSERLPERTGWYLCTLSGNSQKMVDVCRFNIVNGKFWVGIIEYNVVAWKPLPKPYEEGEEDEKDC